MLLLDTELRYNSAIDSLPRIINFSISQYDPHGEILHAITIAIARLGSGKQRQLLFLCPRAIAIAARSFTSSLTFFIKLSILQRLSFENSSTFLALILSFKSIFLICQSAGGLIYPLLISLPRRRSPRCAFVHLHNAK